MLKFINLNGLVNDGEITLDLYNEILNNPDHKTFNTCTDNELLIFKNTTQNEIENKFQIDLSGADDIAVYINWYDGGEYYKLHSKQIGIDECIDVLLENIEQYEPILLKSDNLSKTISTLIKQQIPKAISLYIENLKKEIVQLEKDTDQDYSKIEWQ